jgi:UDP-GlcNAc:undecaprenyl-phosphate/decaprenyl-phosphate GlcNAc-1-phosphate transferase
MLENYIYSFLLSFLTAFGVTLFCIPVIIRVANAKKLYDVPDSRKIHTNSIPTLGGFGIFLGFIFSMTFWSDFYYCRHLQFVTSSLIILSVIGIKDDIVGLSPFKKAFGQIIAALIVVIWGDLRITNMFNIFGIGELPYVASVIFTTFTILVIINAYNLIDGIDGLAASLGIIAATGMGILFYMNESSYQQAILALALSGALLGFLIYNVTPAKIFMGDTGSMVLGFLMSFLCIEMLEFKYHTVQVVIPTSLPLITMSFLFIPLYDLVRVFSIRLWFKRSPFMPDQNHLHHLLLKLGFSHMSATIIMSFFACLLIAFALVFQKYGNYWMGLILLSTCLIFTFVLYALIKKRGVKPINGK